MDAAGVVGYQGSRLRMAITVRGQQSAVLVMVVADDPA
jgi:hypothetical protein